jgi:hypothetical protein
MKKMTSKQKKIGKVMREFKKGELNIGQSSKKVKSPRKPMARGGAVIKNSPSRSEFGNQVDFAQFTHPDGTLKGGVDVEVSNPQETQLEPVGGQRRMLPEKKRSAKWY